MVNTGFSFEASGPWDEIAGVVVDVEELIWDEVREAIEDAVYDTVPDLLEDSLGDVRISEDFEVLDNVYSLLAKINAIDADADGISVHLATRMLPAVTYGVAADGTGPDGAPRYFHTPPTWGVSTSGTNLAVNTDFINQVLFAFFEGGLLNRTLTSDDLGIDMATISLLMPGLTDMVIATEPLLPPVARPRARMMPTPSTARRTTTTCSSATSTSLSTTERPQRKTSTCRSTSAPRPRCRSRPAVTGRASDWSSGSPW